MEPRKIEWNSNAYDYTEAYGAFGIKLLLSKRNCVWKVVASHNVIAEGKSINIATAKDECEKAYHAYIQQNLERYFVVSTKKRLKLSDVEPGIIYVK